MIFATEPSADAEAQAAMLDATELCHTLVSSGRWEPAAAARLADDVRQCGPRTDAERQAA
ncbi:MAG: hypothetical protein M3016_08460 [Actinomycetota bacterium]|nr:hypothetical protein [Actinomycetota bacterium]